MLKVKFLQVLDISMPGDTWGAKMPPELDRKLNEQAGDRSKSEALREVVREYYEQRNRRLAGVFAGLIALAMATVFAIAPAPYAVAVGAAGCMALMIWGSKPILRDMKRSYSTNATASKKSELDDLLSGDGPTTEEEEERVREMMEEVADFMEKVDDTETPESVERQVNAMFEGGSKSE